MNRAAEPHRCGHEPRRNTRYCTGLDDIATDDGVPMYIGHAVGVAFPGEIIAFVVVPDQVSEGRSCDFVRLNPELYELRVSRDAYERLARNDDGTRDESRARDAVAHLTLDLSLQVLGGGDLDDLNLTL